MHIQSQIKISGYLSETTSLAFGPYLLRGGGEGGVGRYITHISQRRQSARFFLQSSELGLPHPLIRRRVFPSPHWFRVGWVRYTLACGRGDGGSQFQRGDKHCGTLCTGTENSTNKNNWCHLDLKKNFGREAALSLPRAGY